MTKRDRVSPILESEEVTKVLRLAGGIIEGRSHISREWQRAHRWAAVPVESAAHFDDEDSERLSRALRRSGHEECFAVAAEPLENVPQSFRVPTTRAGLLDFSDECGAFNYVLLPEDRSLAVLCTTDDYFVVAGGEGFVAEAVGSSVEQARENFLRFAEDVAWTPEVRRNLLSVYSRYAEVG